MEFKLKKSSKWVLIAIIPIMAACGNQGAQLNNELAIPVSVVDVVKKPIIQFINTTGTATTNFTTVSIAWAPVNTAINDVEMDKYYSLYPSPAVSSIYVSGLDIEGIDICSVSGKILMHSNVQNVSISALPKGVYLAVVYTKAGTVVKKFQKI